MNVQPYWVQHLLDPTYDPDTLRRELEQAGRIDRNTALQARRILAARKEREQL